MSLFARLILLVLLAVMPALAIQLHDLFEFRRQRQDEANDTALRLARLMAGDADRIVEGARGILIALAELPFIKYLSPVPCSVYVGQLIARSPQFNAITVRDTMGKLLCSSGPVQRAVNADAFSHLKRAVETREFVIGEYFTGPITGRGTLPLAMPLINADGEAESVVVIGLDLAWLSEYFSTKPLPPDAALVIADRNGTVLVSTPNFGVVRQPISREMQEALQQRGEGVLTEIGGDKIARVTGYTSIAATHGDLSVAVGIPEAAVFKEVELANQRDLMLLVLAAVIAIAAAAVGGALFIRRPISALIATAERWTSGDYSARLDHFTDRSSEIGRLTIEFDKMAQAVRQRDDQLRVANARLEQRVRERTQELAAANERLRCEITERERTEEALRQSQKMEVVGQLTGGIAHDFNNILTVVIGNLDMLQHRLATSGNKQWQAMVGSALRAANRASRLTQQLLAFARQQRLAPTGVDLNAIVAGMSDMLRRTLGPAIRIETVAPAALWRTHLDVNQLESAILNVVINARDAMDGQGQLTIETSNTFLDEEFLNSQSGASPGEYVMIAITDTGCGMSQETVQKAFDPFFTTKEVGKGSGLGLSMVHGFVKQSKGHIDIHSQLGEGTSIELYFPRYAGDESHEPPRRTREPVRARAETILLVEDEDDVRDYSVRVLRELGYEVVEATDAPSAAEVLQYRAKIDLMLTDIGLPGEDGQILAKRAKRLRPELKILFTTGYARDAVGVQGLFDHEVVSKPFTMYELGAKVRRALDGF